MARYLQYAAVLFFATLALAIVAIWVRCYWYTDGASGPLGPAYVLGFEHRQGYVVGALDHRRNRPGVNQWSPVTLHHRTPLVSAYTRYQPGFYWQSLPHDGYAFAAPHGSLAASPMALAAALAFKRRWRFTVRGLLIATTILAALLGMLVYAV